MIRKVGWFALGLAVSIGLIAMMVYGFGITEGPVPAIVAAVPILFGVMKATGRL